MLWVFRRLILIGAVIALPGCTSVLETSSIANLGEGQEVAGGMAYTLGKALLLTKVRIVEEEARVIVCVSDEIQSMDTKHQYVMTFRNSPFAADKITIRTYPNTNILRQIDVKSVDQTDQFIINLAESVGAIKGVIKERSLMADECTGGSGVDLVALHIDPGDAEDMRTKLTVINEAVMRYAALQSKRCEDRRTPAGQRLARTACEEYLRIVRDFGPGKAAPIRMTWTPPKIPAGLAAPDCSAGFCYRPRLTNILTVEVVGTQSDSLPFSLTNNSPLMAMDISRGIAITKTTKITFDTMGQPATVELQKGNETGEDGAEAIELAKLPATVITTYFGAVAKSIKLVNMAVSNQKNLVETRARLQKAKLDSRPTKENAEEVPNAANPTFAMKVTNSISPAERSRSGVGADAKVIPQGKAPPSGAGLGAGNGTIELPRAGPGEIEQALPAPGGK